jgi:hypothetical protein
MQHNRNATPLVRSKEVREDGTLVEIVVWSLPMPIKPCTHSYKYRLYCGVDGTCRVRHDNELGKGDHRHINGTEHGYAFISIPTLTSDFLVDVSAWEHT